MFRAKDDLGLFFGKNAYKVKMEKQEKLFSVSDVLSRSRRCSLTLFTYQQ
jgi:hypothetical protein